MTMNTAPVFPLTPNVGGASFIAAITGANTAMDGTGTVSTILTAGSNGTYLDSIEVRHAGSNSSASTFRVFMNNAGVNSSATNNILIGELTIGTNTVSQVAAAIPYSLPIKKNIPAGYKINVVFGTAGSSAGYLVVPYGMDY